MKAYLFTLLSLSIVSVSAVTLKADFSAEYFINSDSLAVEDSSTLTSAFYMSKTRDISFSNGQLELSWKHAVEKAEASVFVNLTKKTKVDEFCSPAVPELCMSYYAAEAFVQVNDFTRAHIDIPSEIAYNIKNQDKFLKSKSIDLAAVVKKAVSEASFNLKGFAMVDSAVVVKVVDASKKLITVLNCGETTCTEL